MSETQPAPLLTADEIWAAEDIEERDVDVPEWHGRVRVRALTLRQIANVASKSIRRNPQSGQDETNREMTMLMTLVEGMVSPRLTLQEARRMSEKNAGPVSRIVKAINDLGITPEAIDEADKSVWAESDAPIPISASARTGYDASPLANGNAH